MRHEYSRRQAFNAGNSRYLVQDDRGSWYLYDAATFTQLGCLDELAGDCEPLWHATDPNLLYFTAHINGQAFDHPGWVVISSYADTADHNQTSPALILRPEYRKVWLLELRPGGRALNVAHTRLTDQRLGQEAYFAEPQASVARDLSRIIFASDFGGDQIEDYIIGLPSWFAG